VENKKDCAYAALWGWQWYKLDDEYHMQMNIKCIFTQVGTNIVCINTYLGTSSGTSEKKKIVYTYFAVGSGTNEAIDIKRVHTSWTKQSVYTYLRISSCTYERGKKDSVYALWGWQWYK